MLDPDWWEVDATGYEICPYSVCVFFGVIAGPVCGAPNEEQLAKWLKQYPKADANGDGKLTVEEAQAYRKKVQVGGGAKAKRTQRGAKLTFEVDPGWEAERFPEDVLAEHRHLELKNRQALQIEKVAVGKEEIRIKVVGG